MPDGADVALGNLLPLERVRPVLALLHRVGRLEGADVPRGARGAVLLPGDGVLSDLR